MSPVNPNFNFSSFTTEQNLVQSLITEAISIFGRDGYYLKREEVNLDDLFGEDPLAKYSNAYPLTLYLKSQQSFSGLSVTMSKFGLVMEEKATFLISVTDFEGILTGLERPREHDIIYLAMTPTHKYLYDILFVNYTEQLFQLGSLYTFELDCELLQYSQERVQTGVAEIDTTTQEEVYTLSLTMASGSGTYQVGETVYQGTSQGLAQATGTVSAWDGTGKVLSLQVITGTFAGTLPIVGETSGASYLLTGTPDAAPVDGSSDNDSLATDGASVVVNRGDNPFLV